MVINELIVRVSPTRSKRCASLAKAYLVLAIVRAKLAQLVALFVEQGIRSPLSIQNCRLGSIGLIWALLVTFVQILTMLAYKETTCELRCHEVIILSYFCILVLICTRSNVGFMSV